ncbi:FMRFamide peptide receptor frpr-18-like [Physella acuta]|uniref:FMRFamide peptide receptor frpr-18-like n=1 Tax=Physella acuta TaxID=109671 RepID=UPI0027DD8127|nr:FMRFamide peptide receptor frpr-18-like [Physella acuta]
MNKTRDENWLLFVSSEHVETTLFELTDQESMPLALNEDTRRIVMKVLMFAVTPGIGVLGVVGNVLSTLILLRHGLKKCSNILLFSLALADIVYLVSFNSIPKILYETTDMHGFVGFSEYSSQILVVFYSVFMTLDFSSSFVSLRMPMLITIERLIVIFFPLSAHRIITPKRTWCAVTFIVLYSIGLFAYTGFWFELVYKWDPIHNISVGYREFIPLEARDAVAMSVIEDMSVYSLVVDAPLITVAGCIVISIKIKLVSRNRKKMTSKEMSSNRTTKMLLAVCAVYTVTCIIMVSAINLPSIFGRPFSGNRPTGLSVICYQVLNIFICINSSCNFIIYIGLNKNFRNTYFELFS